MHMYMYIPGFSNVAVNVFPDPGYSCSLPFDNNHPELTYFSVPEIV
jgi:hypothetical protein